MSIEKRLLVKGSKYTEEELEGLGLEYKSRNYNTQTNEHKFFYAKHEYLNCFDVGKHSV